MSSTSTRTKAFQITFMLLDVDGVLTNGQLLLHSDGSESKQFFVRDGVGIVLAQRAGLRVGLLSARTSSVTNHRANQLQIPIVVQGATNKLKAYKDLLKKHQLSDNDVAFMGDDLLDLPVLERVGLSAAPVNADPEILSRADWVSRAPAGQGAVREFVEFILRAQGKWDTFVQTQKS